MSTRVAVTLGAVITLVVLSVGVDRGARRRQHARVGAPDGRVHQASARLVGPELALHPAAPWLRHPGRTPPWEAFSAGPCTLDTDPAGSVTPPARGVYAPWAGRARRH